MTTKTSPVNAVAQFQLFTDGGARGNPGPAGTGYSLLHNGVEVKFGKHYIQQTTNNVAEYTALIVALKDINSSNLQPPTLQCNLDSELVVMQILGRYKVKQAHLITLMTEVRSQIHQLEQAGCQITFRHIPRNLNKRADQLVNQAIDAAS